MSQKVIDDVRGTVVFMLGEMRSGLLAASVNLTPEQLVDNAISETLGIMEAQFELKSSVCCMPDGGDLWITDLTKEYWDMVTDGGADQIDLRVAFNENSTST